MPKAKPSPRPRSLQEWMQRTGTSALRLTELVRAETGRSISTTMMSFILTGSRRCSWVNAGALSAVTGVSIKTLVEWPKVSDHAQLSGKRTRRAA